MIKKSILLFTLFAAAALAGPVLTIQSPNPATGAPGQDTGWGFSLSNDTNFYLVLSSITPSPGLLVSGFFQEFAATNFVVVNPLSTVSQSFNNDGSSGFGRFTIANVAAPGVYNGVFTVTYDLYANDPNSVSFSSSPSDRFGLILNQAPASVQVLNQAPEPASFAMLAIAALALRRIQRRF